MSPQLSRRALFGRAARIQPPETQGPRVAVLGGGCLAVQGVACGSCADPCAPRALKMHALLGGRAIPLIDVAVCSGCGDCLNVCPVGALTLAPAGLGENTSCA
ncbi:4Fe-4S dicluster domain-containing protein [Magnetospirillum sulfuroxidans]|uniref:4Fe-4S dicluster domain-containing protein n=1 Tax=Magnetospirillum sulfuroxidans TaxID=611300 RepID=A0ABS5ID77_9PROT|nr:4Fe-4S dicluster domain-containing protein [Magnetospirillum sulfuroxidans]MBR9972241.1 4Fe-4S dicluster domain-containing protein [Magnetospirillum sulfuroxidans]